MSDKATVNAENRTINIEVDMLPFEAFVKSKRGGSMLILPNKWIEVEGEPLRVKVTACAPVNWDGEFGSSLSFAEWKDEH